MIEILHAASTFAMTGLIWIVQLVVYPSFGRMEEDAFPIFHLQYTQRISLVVAPLMLTEMGTLIGMLVKYAGDPGFHLLIGSFLILTCIWLSTAFLQVPCHRMLADRYMPYVHRKLVLTNWIRTLGWSVRSLLLIYLMVRVQERMVLI